ncbi:hypothetical protein VM1G_04144 [Cytospora mali]|uniref:Asteroid domain-containing protein n=1 Tax=Cytospora mali TaxID=578113 RepID=A0A194VWV4_CYTMA|nr:hypothetical protein VM1G_04144 [Valsa mali]
MGIRGLTSTLKPFASRSELRGRVVIDGPALAYHILHICRVSLASSTALEEPPYSVLGSTAIQWLDGLHDCGIEVAAIYFDGYLPAFKKEERLDRIYQSSSVSSNYFSSTSSGIPTASKSRSSSQTLASRNNARQLPIPAFIVPAILDALRPSEKYGHLIHLVPGEADSFCADDVKTKGGTVITSDSDLLLYDLGSSGSVVFLSDLDTPADGVKGMTALTYSQSVLCDKLSLDPGQPGMLSFAFELKMDPYRTLASWVSRSKRQHSATTHASEYTEFVSQYLNSPGATLTVPEHIRLLDPRISEFVLGWTGNAAFETLVPNTVPTESAVLYLPSLLDRWDQASAWNPSTTIRQLAYSFCRGKQDTRSMIVEYRRTLSRTSKGQVVELLEDAQAKEVLAELLSLCMKAIKKTTGPSQLQWVVLCLCQEVRHAADQGNESLAVKLWRKASKSKGHLDPGNWDAMHLAGQIQGTLYSLRILHQVLRCQIGYLVTSAGLGGQVAKLMAYLSTLPPISEFPLGPDMRTLFGRLQQAGMLDSLADMAGISGPFAFNEPGRRSKGKQQTGRQEKGETKARSSTNPFDILGENGG